jgi:hypothetical protein
LAVWQVVTVSRVREPEKPLRTAGDIITGLWLADPSFWT